MSDQHNPEPSKTPKTDKACVDYRLLDFQQRFNVMFATCEQIETELTASESRAADLESKLAAVTKERDEAQRSATFWEQTTSQHLRNEQFYHELVTQIGEPFGVAAKTSDDGSIQQDVLALKVPELVDQLRQRVAESQRQLLELAQSVIDARRKPGVGPAVPYNTAIKIVEMLSTKGGDEPRALPKEPSTPSTAVASNVVASNAAPESSDPTGTVATLEERVEVLERKGTRIDGKAALEKMLSETSHPTGTAAKNPFLNSTVTSNEGPIPTWIADEASRAIVGTAVKPHNPDNLTPEQVGGADGWRLLDEDEILPYSTPLESIIRWNTASHSWQPFWCGTGQSSTYRTKLTRAELRKARGLDPEPARTGSPESETEPTPWDAAAGIRFRELATKEAIESATCEELKELENLTKQRRERETHAPMAYETFVLLKLALEKELTEKANLQNTLDNARAEVTKLKEQLAFADAKAASDETVAQRAGVMISGLREQVAKLTQERDAAIAERKEGQP